MPVAIPLVEASTKRISIKTEAEKRKSEMQVIFLLIMARRETSRSCVFLEADEYTYLTTRKFFAEDKAFLLLLDAILPWTHENFPKKEIF